MMSPADAMMAKHPQLIQLPMDLINVGRITSSYKLGEIEVMISSC
ncbi:MAG: hypothetical protein ACRDFB_05245 [Rhabdochlamydiaceae bacterium]